MATVTRELSPAELLTKTSSFGVFNIVQGTNFPAQYRQFDPAAQWDTYWQFKAVDYGSGNLTLLIDWNAASATSGDCKWSCAIACVTPNVDTGSWEAKAFTTAQTVTTTHPGTTALRLLESSITISNLDSLAAGDMVVVQISRLGNDVADTMAGNANLISAAVQYSSV